MSIDLRPLRAEAKAAAESRSPEQLRIDFETLYFVCARVRLWCKERNIAAETLRKSVLFFLADAVDTWDLMFGEEDKQDG